MQLRVFAIFGKMWAFLTKNKDDIIYLGLLLASVAIGPYYRSINKVQAKKYVGTYIGVLLISIISGYNAIHPILSALVGCTVIKLASVR